MARFFFRIDDVAPNMSWDNFGAAIEIFKRNNIKPLIAVIPDLKDPKLLNYAVNSNFWKIVKELSDSGFVVAQHGYQHVARGDGGVLKIHSSGEFGGVDFERQKDMIGAGHKIMEEKNITANVFVAPRHSFDKNTLKALGQSDFYFISDGIALWPFKKWGLVWLPQILWRPRRGMVGMITVALHPNTMNSGDMLNLEKFIEKNRDKIGDFTELMGWYKKAGSIKLFFLYFINNIFKVFWYILFYLKFRLPKFRQ